MRKKVVVFFKKKKKRKIKIKKTDELNQRTFCVFNIPNQLLKRVNTLQMCLKKKQCFSSFKYLILETMIVLIKLSYKTKFSIKLTFYTHVSGVKKC